MITSQSKTIGRIENKNTLNNELAGVNAVISVSSKKQSNEKKLSFGDPIFSLWENTLLKLLGSLMLNVSAAEINWI